MFIDTTITDVLAGYNKIRQAEAKLVNKWRGPLLESYARQRGRHDQARARYEPRRGALNRMALYGLTISFLMFLAGIAAERIGFAVRGELDLILYPLGTWLMWIGGVLIGFLVLIWLLGALLFKPRPPQHPLKPPMRNKLFRPLLPQWWEELNSPLPTSVSEHGDRGENAVVHQLHRILDDSYFILHQLQQQYGDDIDVVVVGPKGVWAFEVKYWSGTIEWRNGRWRRTKEFHGPGGIPTKELVEVRQDPDKQWSRMAEDIVKTLRRQARDLVFTTPSLTEIHGGIVFSHPDGVYDIPTHTPFEWGRLEDLRRWLQAAPIDENLDERKLIGVLSALLARHHDVAQSDEKNVFSMDRCADELIRKAEARITQYLGKQT